jgi:MoaA/NifB/PqqE/SkfB family radical SAM enzyme
MNWKKLPESQGWLQSFLEWVIRQRTFMPRMIDLEVSRECNLSCPECMRLAASSLSHQSEKYCSIDRFKEIYEQIPTIGTLNFMGDGEPLMNPELNDIIKYASSKGVCTVITTNATLVNRKDIECWKQNKVYRIHASVDAATKQTYDEMRSGAVWEETLENLRLIGASGIPFCINTVLTEKNIGEMQKMARLCKTVGAQELTFLMPICSRKDDTETRPKFNGRNKELFANTARMCRELGVKWKFPLTLNPTFRRFSFPFGRPEISIEGDIWACCYSLGRGTNWVMGHPITIEPCTYNMGNMFTDGGFRKVWYGDAYRELREVYKRSEVRKGTVITRLEYLRRILEVENRENGGRFDHCEICPARWGTACS